MGSAGLALLTRNRRTGMVKKLSGKWTIIRTAEHTAADANEKTAGLAILALIGLALFAAAFYHGDRATGCGSDFSSFYAGGRLAFSPQLYTREAARQIQRTELGCNETFHDFIRPPFVAVLFWPLARLPFPTAVAIWRLICVASVLIFVLLWPGRRLMTFCACCWSLPLLAAFTWGQDVPVLLLLAGLSIALVHRRCDFAAGVVLSLCAAKPHVFALWVAVALLRRSWRFASGVASGGAVLAAISFCAFGASWPTALWQSANAPTANPHPETMINLHGLFAGFHAPARTELVVSAVILGVLGKALLRASAPMAFSLALAGGVLLGGHSYLYDLAFCIPLILQVIAGGGPRWLAAAAILCASPAMFYVSTLPPPATTAHLVLPIFLILTGTSAGAETSPPAAVLELCEPESQASQTA